MHLKQWTTNKQQSIVDKGWLLTRGSQFSAPTNPPKKDTICHCDWGEGGAGFKLAQKGRTGDVIVMKWTMKTMMTMARGGKQGKSINDSISEHKCIITSKIIYSNTIYHTNKPSGIFSRSSENRTNRK